MVYIYIYIYIYIYMVYMVNNNLVGGIYIYIVVVDLPLVGNILLLYGYCMVNDC